MALGVAAIPVWTAIDRGNSVGFAVPIALVFLVALCRRRWRLAAIMVVLAALVKPQFVVLAVALFAARQWRWGGLTVAGAAVTNLAAYLLWPRNFPTTILQSIHDTLGFGSGGSSASGADLYNMSFAEGLLMIPDDIKAGETGGKIPESFIAGPRSVLGYVVLVLVVVCLMALGGASRLSWRAPCCWPPPRFFPLWFPPTIWYSHYQSRRSLPETPMGHQDLESSIDLILSAAAVVRSVSA